MATVVLQPDDTTGFDHTMDSFAPNNSGDNTDFSVGHNTDPRTRRGIVKFDLSSIPSGATISSATLTFYMEYAGNLQSSTNEATTLYRLKRATSESAGTWNKYDGTNSWSTAGAGDTTNDREGTSAGTGTILYTSAIGDAVNFTMNTTKLQEMLTGGSFTNNGWVVIVDNETGNRLFYFGASGTAAARRPKLTVSYYDVKKVAGVTRASLKKAEGKTLAQIKKIAGVSNV